MVEENVNRETAGRNVSEKRDISSERGKTTGGKNRAEEANEGDEITLGRGG